MTTHEKAKMRILIIVSGELRFKHNILAEGLGIILGKNNYPIKALLEKALIKANNVRRSYKKFPYLTQPRISRSIGQMEL